jgi:excisionase family DNA binding protein
MNTDKLAASVDEVRHISGLGKSTIYAKIASGELRSVTVGRRRLVSMASLRKMLGEAA